MVTNGNVRLSHEGEDFEASFNKDLAAAAAYSKTLVQRFVQMRWALSRMW